MIRKYTFGTPLPTDAVVRSVPAEQGPLPYFTLSKGEDGSLTFSLTLRPEEVLFGLGQGVRGIDKRGHRYESWNSDVFNHTEERPSLYGSHNFLVFFSPERLFGVYLDDPGKITWDLGYTARDQAVITVESGSLDLYLIEEDSLPAIARAFRGLTGRSYIPPRWAFGYIQSRWGYASEEEVRTVADEHRKRHIPLDAVCLDIDYMVDFKNFTWNPKAFPDLKKFQAEMKEDHLRLVPIIDAGIKVEEGYAPYDTGKAGDCFCKKEDGSDFVAAVWPGRCCFPDFLREDVRRWFGDLYLPLLEAGIEGFWNDMNEPALFYSDEGLADAFAAADKIRAGGVDYESTWWLKDVFNGMANSMDDYRRFYHLVDGKPVRHDRVHNLYGAGMLPQLLHRGPPQRRHLAGRQLLLVEPPEDGPADAPEPEPLRLPLHRLRPGRLRLQRDRGPDGALPAAGRLHAPDAQPFRPPYPGAGDLPFQYLGNHAGHRFRALCPAALPLQ